MTTKEFVFELFGTDPNEPEKMTAEAAQCDIDNFRAEGWELPEDLTAEEYAEEWNRLYNLREKE